MTSGLHPAGLCFQRQPPISLSSVFTLCVVSVTKNEATVAWLGCQEEETRKKLGFGENEMDSETALHLVRQGATLLLLDVPQHTLVGIDTQVFSAGPAFKGIKMIPPGPHFIYYSSSNRHNNEFSPMVGFFVHTNLSEVVVQKWNQEEERLVKLSEEEEERYRQATKRLEFDKFLGPYALNCYREWKQLSNYITKTTIEQIEPIGGEITVVCETRMFESIPKTAMEKILDDQLKNKKFSKVHDKSESKGCYYTPIPRVIKGKGIPGQELTSLNLDKTTLLESILLKNYEGVEESLLGELQFAFIAFLMGQSLEAFLQWKSLVCLLFGCTKAPLHKRSQLFAKSIKVIYYQLNYGLQKDFTDGEREISSLDHSLLAADNFLHYLCRDFFSLVQEASNVDGDLLIWTRKLRELLESTLGWDIQRNSGVDGLYFEEDDEFSPVVEMLDEASAASNIQQIPRQDSTMQMQY